MSNQKYIALIDCDSFFVSCEQKRDSSLCGKPVSVVSGDRGCVISRSKEAKKLGVKMGMPLFMAKEQFPQGIYINADHYYYTVISKQIMTILKDMSPFVQVYSIDEAFVDMTGLTKVYKMNYFKLAKFIQDKIWDEVGIPVSIGVSRSKTLAKLASDYSKNKKVRITVLGKRKTEKFLQTASVDDIWGFGRKLSDKLKGYCIKTAYDFIKKDDEWIKKRFGKNGLFTKYELLGELLSPVSNEVTLPKSISDTKSFSEFTSDLKYLKNELQIHIHQTCYRLRKINSKCSTIGLILKTKDFQSYYVKTKLKYPTNFEFDVSKSAFKELEKIYDPSILYRSIGIVLEDFIAIENEQIGLFEYNPDRIPHEKLGKALDKLEKKYGRNVVRTGFTTKDIPFKQGFLTSPQDVD